MLMPESLRKQSLRLSAPVEAFKPPCRMPDDNSGTRAGFAVNAGRYGTFSVMSSYGEV
jgi:hypothetical protein